MAAQRQYYSQSTERSNEHLDDRPGHAVLRRNVRRPSRQTQLPDGHHVVRLRRCQRRDTEDVEMSQTKLGSFVEAWMNVAIVFSINYACTLLILPLYGFHISLRDNFTMGCIYTIVSVVRSYY